ncbi:flagellar export chaperone FliS [Desulforudis sp. 1088]|uniref:flagellar export chaperone FliS n=2 Tax=Candidatus Desulforudis TaxID=471826 RepID=UPI003CE4E154
MAMTNPYARYKETAIAIARPEELVLMCYRGLAQYARQAAEAVGARDIPAAHQALVRAQDICTYLRTTVDTRYEIGERLDALYEYMYNRLVEANLSKASEPIEEVLALAEDLRDTWAAAIRAGKEGEQG